MTAITQQSSKEGLGDLPRWDLTDLYPASDSRELRDDLTSALKRSEAFEADYKGKLAQLPGDGLAEAIKEYEAIEDLLGRVSAYAYLLYSCHMEHEDTVRFFQNMTENVTDISKLLLFFTLELNQIADSSLQEKVESSEGLQRYTPWIRDVRVYRKYQLSDEMETLLHEKSLTSRQAWNRLFDETLAGLRFPFGEDLLSCAQILDKLSSADSTVREKAAKSISKVFLDNIKSFAFITNTLAKDKEIEDRLRGFAKPISSRNVSNFIEDEVVDALVSTVKKNYADLTHRYYQLKATWFDQSQLAYWDRNAPLPNEDTSLIPWEQAKEIVLTAYQEFSPLMADIGQQFFDENWIDAAVVNGKESGAYSHPTVPSAHPYILMNYQGKIRDVMTLAHELGHGVHQVLSSRQGALMADTPLTLAETASVFGEQLTFQALLKQESDEMQRRVMIANKVEDMLNTVVRQIAFLEFERQVHDERRKGELSSSRINEIWMQVQGDSLGPAIRLDKEYRVYWAYIPHFIHSPFYVYSYAFGDCLVNSLYAKYLEQPDGFETKYLDMLKAGGTLWHKDLLAPFGLDATDPEFWQGGLDVIKGYIDTLG